MQPALWLQATHKRLADLVKTIDDWAPSTLYGAVAGATLLPLAMTSGDPKEVLAGVIGGMGANLLANQLEAWKARNDDNDNDGDEQAFAKELTAAAKADTALRDSLDELLRRTKALELLIHQTDAAARDDLVQQLTRQFAKVNSGLDVKEIYVGGDWINVGNIESSSYLAIGSNAVVAGPGAHVGDKYYQFFGAPPDESARTARRRAYLHYLYTEARRLSLEGIDRKAAGDEQDAAVPLDAIYTALLTTATEGAEPAATQPIRRDEQERQQRSAVAQLDRYQRLVLLGAPGSGKSTFVNFVTLCLAGQALADQTVNLDLLTAPLPTENDRPRRDEEKTPPRQPWAHGELIPVRVILRHFAAACLPVANGKAGADLLWQYIAETLTAASLGDFVEELKAELRQQGGLLLLDGLDEVPDADQQREQLKAVISAFAGVYRHCRLLITSRPYAYRQEDWRLTGFTETTLAPFSANQIRLFVERWYQQIAPLRNYKAEDAAGRAVQLQNAIFRSNRLHTLAEQPLLLTLMASLHAWHGSDLPEKRERLYAEAVDLLLERWEKQRVERRRDGALLTQPSLQEYLQVGRDAILTLLEQIAYTVHASQPQLVGSADISRTTLVNGLLEISRNPQVRPLELLNYLSQRAGLLLPEGNTLFRFPHRTFQEYLAARYLTGQGVEYPDHLAALVRTEPERWREVALLAVAKAADGMGSSVWTMVDAFCPVAPTDPTFTVADGWGAHLAGQALLDAARLDNLNRANQQKVVRIRQGLLYVMRSPDFLPTERALAGRTLAALGDPRFRADAWFLPNDPMLGFVEIPVGKFIMGSDKDQDKEARNNETPQHEVTLPAFYIARYPVTVAQFRAFVEDTGEQPSDADSLTDPDNHPVRYVTWFEATRYCQWLTERLRAWDKTPVQLAEKLAQGWQLLLPSEAEWERAARGFSTSSDNGRAAVAELVAEGRRYPWGDEDVDPNRANYKETGIGTTSAVGCFPAGATPEGIEEFTGNVWEWTRSRYIEYPYPSDEQARQERESVQGEGIKNSDRFVRRGGSHYNDVSYLRAPLRSHNHADIVFNFDGFRVVVGGGAAPGS